MAIGTSPPQASSSPIASPFRAIHVASKTHNTHRFSILKKHNVELERLAQGLLEYETLDGVEIKIIVEGGTLVRKDADDTPAKPGPVRKSRTGLPGTGRSKKPGGEPA